MSLSLTPSKRQHNGDPNESNGQKFQKLEEKQPSKSSHGRVVFRVLCPIAKLNTVTGKEDEILSQIRSETGAKIRIDDPIHGCDERVIFIMGSEEKKDDMEESPSEKDSQLAVKKALVLVCEKILERGEETENKKEDDSESLMFTLRLLVLSGHVGCLLGRGGSVIKQMTNESGAQIRVLPRDKLPSCASSSDEVVQITGSQDAVKKAVNAVFDQIMENPPQEDESSHPSRSGPPSRISNHSGPIRSFPSRAAPFGPKFHDSFMPEILTFRMLCANERVGGIIGKGGAVIKTLQHETGCDIKVLDGGPDGEDRVVVVSGLAHPEDRISPVQDAVLRVQARIAKAIPELKEKDVTAKLLVSSNQIGCLLGKGGSIIAEMRKMTRAYIRILGKDQIPKSASEAEEVVQITGELGIVQEAILQITTRLVHHFFRDTFPSINHPLSPMFLDHGPPPPPFLRRRELSPPGMFPKFGPSFREFDSALGPPPRGRFLPHEEYPPFMHDIHRPVLPHISERPMGPQSLMERGGPIGSLDYDDGPRRRIPGFGGGSQPGMITNTTVEVVVPTSIVPLLYGEDGGCLRQIRQISEAKIVIADHKTGAPETFIKISGTPEETHAAQSLIQAFVISETQSS